MSSPSSVEPCPEPLPYSKNLDFAADVESSLSPSVLDSVVAKNQFVPVDSILGNQLGPITNPVANTAFPAVSELVESKAVPILSSQMGSDVNNSYTLLNNLAPSLNESFNGGPRVVENLKNTGSPSSGCSSGALKNMTDKEKFEYCKLPKCKDIPFCSLILNSNAPTHTPGVHALTHAPAVNAPTHSPAVYAPTHSPAVYAPTHSPAVNHFTNDNKNLPEFIKGNKVKNVNTKEHFGNKRKEHFSLTTGSSMLDIVILVTVVGLIAYYVLAPSNTNVDNIASKIPVVSSLVDPAVSDTHKLLIVTAIVIAVIVISKMMK